MRLNRDHPNRANFEPDQGFDPSLDLALVGADWQIKVQGLASNWQDNLVVTSNRTGEQDALTRIEVLLPFLALFLEHDVFVCKHGNYCDPVCFKHLPVKLHQRFSVKLQFSCKRRCGK